MYNYFSMCLHFFPPSKMLLCVAAIIPAFQASPTGGFADFSTHEANAIQTRHMSDCLRGKSGESNPFKKEMTV